MNSEPLSLPERTRLSKMLALVLRHRPETADVELNEYGAVDLDVLTDSIAQLPGWEFLETEHIISVVEGGPRQRFEIDHDANTIRARYGHSLSVHIKYDPAEPPTVLYHGSEPEAAADILADGLKPMGRQYVHLSVSPRVAFDVGSRRCDEPVIISVNCTEAAAGGLVFHNANKDIWLTEHVPAKYLSKLGR